MDVIAIWYNVICLGSLMVERHFYMVDTGVQFSNEVPQFEDATATVATMARRTSNRISGKEAP